MSERFEFGEYVFRTRDRSLELTGRRVRLAARPAALLLSLLKANSELATKETLLREVWGDTHVEENNLTFQIRELRKALRDSAVRPQYIATVHGQGYHLIPTVRLLLEQRTPLTPAGVIELATSPVAEPAPSALPRPDVELPVAVGRPSPAEELASPVPEPPLAVTPSDRGRHRAAWSQAQRWRVAAVVMTLVLLIGLAADATALARNTAAGHLHQSRIWY